MRVGIVGLQHETNTFIEAPTGMDAFRGNLLAAGDSLRDAVAGSKHELGGFFAGLAEAGVTAVPLFGARALPYGLVAADAYAELKRRLLAEIQSQLPLDGLLVAPHGAAVSEEVPDMDGDWLQAVRALVGADVPIVATGDPHANLSERMADAVDAIVAYRTNPHVDQRDRGLEAARLLVGRLNGAITPRMAAVFPPVAISIDKQCTDEPPLRALVEKIDAVRERPDILSASLWLGFPYADVAEMGSAVTVVSNGDPPVAKRAADEIALALWDMRDELQADLPGVSDAVDRADRLSPPVCLLDVGDNVGGGPRVTVRRSLPSSTGAVPAARSSVSTIPNRSRRRRLQAATRFCRSASVARPTACTAKLLRSIAGFWTCSTAASSSRRSVTAVSITTTRVERRWSKAPKAWSSCSPRSAWCRSAFISSPTSESTRRRFASSSPRGSTHRWPPTVKSVRRSFVWIRPGARRRT